MYSGLWMACPAVFLLVIGNSGCSGDGAGNGGSPCIEDASIYITLTVEPDSVMNRDSPCPNVKPQLESRLAQLHFTNTHPARKISIASVVMEQSNIEAFPVDTCALAVQQGKFSSLSECHPGLGVACSSPVSVFLAPGESSAPWLYQCKQEQLYPSSSGECSTLQLETLSWSVFAHAVFCENNAYAKVNLCASGNPRWLDNGWFSIQSNSCPAG